MLRFNSDVRFTEVRITEIRFTTYSYEIIVLGGKICF